MPANNEREGIIMKRFFRNFRFTSFLVSLLCIALGLAILIWPRYAEAFMCYAFGGVLVLGGILEIASYITGEKTGFINKLLLITGIISAVAGVWILFTPKMVYTLTMIVLGIVLLYHGGMDIKHAFDIKNCEGRGWRPALVFGLLTCAVGILLLVNPFKEKDALLLVAGIGFLFDGLTDVFTVVTLASAKAHYEQISSGAPVIEIEPGTESAEPVEGNTMDTPALDTPEKEQTAPDSDKEFEKDAEAVGATDSEQA